MAQDAHGEICSKTMAKKLKVALVDQDMSQADLAQLVGVSQQTVSAWVNGSADRMSVENAVKVAKALDWPLDELFGKEG